MVALLDRPMASPDRVDLPQLGQVPGFRRFWTAATVSAFGSTVTPLAIQLLC